MTDCVIVQPIARAGVELLQRAGLTVFEAPATGLEILRPHLLTARAVITRNEGFSVEAMALSPELVLIASHGSGTDRIAKNAAAERGIRIVSTPGTNARSVAEHVLALILACAKHLPAADHAVRQGKWAIRERLETREISDRSLGLIGYGHVARHLAGMAHALGLRVSCCSAHASTDELAAAGVEPVPGIAQLLAGSDIVSLHGRPQGAPILDENLLGLVRRGTILVNTARGSLIDETALSAALRDGRVAAAGLDVFQNEPLSADSPLLLCPNLILTPHIGGSSVEARERTAREVARRVIEGLGLRVPE